MPCWFGLVDGMFAVYFREDIEKLMPAGWMEESQKLAIERAGSYTVEDANAIWDRIEEVLKTADENGVLENGWWNGAGTTSLETVFFIESEYIENPAESPFPASRFYENSGMTAQTFLEEDGSETLISLATWKKGATSAGIKIGSTLEELKAAYPTMQLLDGMYDTGYGFNVKYNRMYVAYRPEDGTNCFYQFYLDDKKVVMIEVLDGLDMPRVWYDFEAPLGMENLHWECISSGGQVTWRYFDVLEDGTEAYVLDITGTVEHHDLDGDGKLEILNYLWDGNTQNLEIYGATETGLTIINVNETLGSAWSSFMGNVGNLHDSTYRTCIYAGMEPGGSSDVYSYQNGQLALECTFDEAMGWVETEE